MPVNNNNYEIPHVEVDDTFESWRRKTNDDIIDKANMLKLYEMAIASPTGGGITASVATDGGVDIQLNSIIQKGVTFLNVDVGFSGGVFINNDVLNLNRDGTPAEIMGATAGIVLGSSTGGFTMDGGHAAAGETYSINGFTGPYWLNNNGFWFTEQGLRLDSWTGTQIKFGSSGSNNLLDFCGPGQGYTTDPGMTYPSDGGEYGIRANEIRVYNNRRDPVVNILDDGTVEFTSGVNRKRVEQTDHGFTFGNVIRFDGTDYIKAYAGATAGDGTTYDVLNAEVVGIVSRIVGHTGGGGMTGSTFDVTFNGEVRGDFSTVTGTDYLTPGCIYYLSTTGEGLLTPNQPSSVGLTYDTVVSKPILYALGQTAGLIIPYRGQIITPESATIATYMATGGVYGTADIYNTHRIAITNTHGFTSGDVISQVDTTLDSTGYTLANRMDETARSVLGIAGVEDTAANTINIITSGLITGHDNISFAGNNPGHYCVGSNYGGLSADAEPWTGYYKPVATILDAATAVVHVGGVQTGRPENGFVAAGGAESAVTDFSSGGGASNYFINGNLYYWRRGLATSSAHTGTADIFFADRWKRTSGPSGGTGATYDFSLQRKSFDDVQDIVPGNPDYYFDIKGSFATGAAGSTTGYYSRFEQRLENSNKFSQRTLNVSLYAKSTVAGGTVGISFVRSSDGISETKSDIGEFVPTTSWKRYTKTFSSPVGTTMDNNNSYCGVAFYTTDMNRYLGEMHTGTLSVAQLKLEEGQGSISYPEVDKQRELERCERFYQTSYPNDKYPGSSTLVTTRQANTSSPEFIITGLEKSGYIFPVKMRSTPAVSIWSPSGSTANAFNKTTGKDLTRSAGGRGAVGGRRSTVSTKAALISSDTELGCEIHIVGGYVPLDVITFHYEADSEL